MNEEIDYKYETGIYYRVYKDNKYQDVLLEQLPDVYIKDLLKNYDKDNLMTCIIRLSSTLKSYQDEDIKK